MSIEAMKQALEDKSLYEITGRIEDIDKCIVHRSVLRQAIATEESSATQEPVAYEDWYDSSSCGHCGMVNGHTRHCKHYTHPQAKAKQEPKREPLTDEQFLELLLRKGSTELVGYSTFISNSRQMQGRVGLLNGAKLLKEFVEAAHGIKGEA